MHVSLYSFVLPFLDVNECMEGTDTCQEEAECMNNQGSFTCVCDAMCSGWQLYCCSIDIHVGRNAIVSRFFTGERAESFLLALVTGILTNH